MSKFGAFLTFLAIIVSIGAVLYTIQPFKIIYQKNDMQRIRDLENIAKALDLYYTTYGNYPSSDPETYEILSADKERIPWGSSFGPFSEILPKDPSFNRKYVYYSDEEKGNKAYQIYASLENPESVEGSCGTNDCPNVPGVNLCEEKGRIAAFFLDKDKPCNYGITSGNVSP